MNERTCDVFGFFLIIIYVKLTNLDVCDKRPIEIVDYEKFRIHFSSEWMRWFEEKKKYRDDKWLV